MRLLPLEQGKISDILNISGGIALRINTVDENRIEIYLSNDEINDIFGGYSLIDYDEPECRTKIHSLFSAAAPDTVLPLNCKRIYIEVKPLVSGCIISYTKIYSASKKYRNASRTKYITLMFENSDNMLSSLGALKELECQSSELYISGKRYAIIAILKSHNANAITHLSEYCKISHNKSDMLKVREYWHAVCKKGAIVRLANAFLK